MASLSPSELYKEGRGERIIEFIRRYENNIPFELVSGGTIILKYDKTIADVIKNKRTWNTQNHSLTDMNDVPIAWNKLQKTEAFGGGKGSGAGAAATNINESAQCVYLEAYQAKYKNNSVNATDIIFTTDELKASFNSSLLYVNTTDDIIALDDTWVKSSKAIAYTFFNNIADKNKKYVFHHRSGFIDTISNKFAELNSKDKKIFSNINKWNPSDIWAIEINKINDISTTINNCSTLVELNQTIYKLLKSKKLIGLSLKKTTGKTSHHKYLNFNSKSSYLNYEFLRFTSSPNGFFASKDMYIIFDGGKLQFHNFGGTTVQGQISGTAAFGGKVGQGTIMLIIKRLAGKENTKDNTRFVFRKDDLLKILSNTKSVEFEELIKNYLYEEYSKVTIGNKLTSDKFLAECKKRDKLWLFSKIYTIQLMNIIKKYKIEQHFLFSALSYAGSEDKMSSSFVKLY